MAENRTPEQIAGEMRARAAETAKVEGMLSALDRERQGYVQREAAAKLAGDKDTAAAMAQRLKDVDASRKHWDEQHPDGPTGDGA